MSVRQCWGFRGETHLQKIVLIDTNHKDQLWRPTRGLGTIHVDVFVKYVTIKTLLMWSLARNMLQIQTSLCSLLCTELNQLILLCRCGISCFTEKKIFYYGVAQWCGCAWVSRFSGFLIQFKNMHNQLIDPFKFPIGVHIFFLYVVHCLIWWLT